MDDADLKAAYDLAAELEYFEAAKFLRREIGYGLRDATWDAERIALARPSSPLAESYRKHKEAP